MAAPLEDSISITTSFYRFNENFHVCEVNNSKFAIFDRSISSEEDLSIDLNEFNIIFLAPLEAIKDISIKAISVIAYANIHTQNGKINIEASGKFFLMGAKIMSYGKVKITNSGFDSVPMFDSTKTCIVEEFREGIANENGEIIISAFENTFDTIKHPLEEAGERSIDLEQVFEMFNIPLEV